jgi:hypothetical protein
MLATAMRMRFSTRLIGVNCWTVELLLQLHGAKLIADRSRDEYLFRGRCRPSLSQEAAVQTAPRGNVSNQFDTSHSSLQQSTAAVV